jgi:putative methionine-R-sulfoxide reductase with GAF domain
VNEADINDALAPGRSARLEREQRAGRVAATVRRFGGYGSVGVYNVSGEITVIGWDGPAPPADPRFPRDQGLCDAAVAAGVAVMVGDVAAHPRHLMTHDDVLGDRRAGLPERRHPRVDRA